MLVLVWEICNKMLSNFLHCKYRILPNSSRGAYLISDPLGEATIRGGALIRGFENFHHKSMIRSTLREILG